MTAMAGAVHRVRCCLAKVSLQPSGCPASEVKFVDACRREPAQVASQKTKPAKKAWWSRSNDQQSARCCPVSRTPQALCPMPCTLKSYALHIENGRY